MNVPRWFSRAFAILACSLALLLLGSGMAFELSAPSRDIPGRPDPWLTVFIELVMSAYPLVGALLVIRQPANRIGWLFLVLGLASGLIFGAETYVLAYQTGTVGALPGLVLVAWLYSWIWITFPTGIVFTMLLFPNGHLASPRWRGIAWLMATGVVLTAGAAALRPGPISDLPGFENPFGITALEHVVPVAESIGMALFLAAAVAASISLILRFRRSRGIERQQLKWFVAVGSLAIGALLVAGMPLLIFGEARLEATALMPIAMAGWLTGLLAFGLLPVAVSVAVLRYRLYNIDLIIRRTLVYGALSVMLAAVYAGGVLGLQALLAPFTDGGALAVAGSTLAAAALFRPLRTRVQQTVDRRFYRSRYDAQQTLEGFSSRLRDEVVLDSLTDDLRSIVQSTMQPSSASVWLRHS